MKADVTSFADYVAALAYHEARNVRHLVNKGHLDKTPYRLLIDALENHPEKAWKQLQPLRRKAAGASSAQQAEAVFRRRFHLSLEDLVALSEDPNWRGTQTGGNRWVHIDRFLIKLRSAIDQSDHERTTEMLEVLPLTCHNTGCLGEKLKRLDESLAPIKSTSPESPSDRPPDPPPVA